MPRVRVHERGPRGLLHVLVVVTLGFARSNLAIRDYPIDGKQIWTRQLPPPWLDDYSSATVTDR
jgi:hypothetical protein